MRFVIVNGLPYLLHDGKTYAVRWDAKGFTVGAEVKLASVPSVTLSEISVKARYPHSLDSIGKQEQQEVRIPTEPVKTEQEEDPSKKQPERARKARTTNAAKRGGRKTTKAVNAK